MPYVKLIPLRTWSATTNVYGYLQNPVHPNHVEYLIEPMQSRRADLSPLELLAQIRKTFEKLVKDKGPGRPIKNLFQLHICRVPDGTWLTPEERVRFAEFYLPHVAPEGLACYCWHVNRVTGAADLNALTANLIDLDHPQARRRSGVNEIEEARDAADIITEILNRQRLEQDRTLIVTMPKRQQQIASQKRGHSLEEQLAQNNAPVTLKNMKSSIEELGYEVARFSPEMDYISIRLPSSNEQPQPTEKRRGKRFKITSLLKDVADFRLHRNMEITSGGFHHPRDTDFDRMVEDWNL